MTDLDNLISDLEAATEGSRELDDRIAEAVHQFIAECVPDQERGAGHWISPTVGPVYVPDYTTSLDDALTLVPKGWWWDVSGGHGMDPQANLFRGEPPYHQDEELEAGANTPALAICAAALKERLRAKQVEEQHHD